MKKYICERNLKIFGMSEKEVLKRLCDITTSDGAITVAPYALTGEMCIKVSAKNNQSSEIEKSVESTASEIVRRLGDVVYSSDGKTLPEVVVELLCKNHMTVSAAESCTGGGFAKMITDVPGASAVLDESYVTYASRSKIKILGVEQATIEKHTVVSAEVAREMADGVRRISGADIGVSFTGFAGPVGDEVGLVYMGISQKDNTAAAKLCLNGDRDKIRYTACLHAFDAVRKILQK